MRISIVFLLAMLTFAAPASASRVLELKNDGRLVPEENPYLPPPMGPEVAVPGGEQACPLPKARAAAARGPSVTAAIATARRRRSISAAAAARYQHSYFA